MPAASLRHPGLDWAPALAQWLLHRRKPDSIQLEQQNCDYDRQDKANALPEHQRIAFGQGRPFLVHQYFVRMTQVVDEFGELSVALVRIGVHRLSQYQIDPRGY